jgi:hypothetical protein
MRDLRKTRQQLLSFPLRHGLDSPYGHWTTLAAEPTKLAGSPTDQGRGDRAGEQARPDGLGDRGWTPRRRPAGRCSRCSVCSVNSSER